MPSHWSFDPILSASDGTGDERATTNDNDAIDAEMHARAGDAGLIPWLLVPDCLCERHRGRDAVTLVACYRI